MGKKISELSIAAKPLSGQEVIPMNQNGVTVTASLSDIKTYTLSGLSLENPPVSASDIVGFDTEVLSAISSNSVSIKDTLDVPETKPFTILRDNAQTLIIPENVSTLDAADCLPESLWEIDGGSNITSFTNTVPSAVYTIKYISLPEAISFSNPGDSTAFSSLEAIYLPKVQTVSDFAFNESPLIVANLPEVVSVGEAGVNYCLSLVSVDMPKLSSIGNTAFIGCTSLTEIYFPLAEIVGNASFANCTGLLRCGLPAANSIGNNTFAGDEALTEIYLNCPLSAIGSAAFTGTDAVSTPTIYLRPSPNTPAGWTEGSGLSIAGATVDVAFDWTIYPNLP